MLRLRPDGSSAYYAACVEAAVEDFPTDPNDGTYVALGDDDFVEVVLDGGAEVSFYGQSYDRFYIGSNGYITFDSGDTRALAKLVNHFDLPRISGMFTDLNPQSQSISYKQLDDKVVVTFEDVALYGDENATNSFQIELFLADEAIHITYLGLGADDGIVVGISKGEGVPVLFTESDLSGYIECCVCGDFDGDGDVDMDDVLIMVANWVMDDCSGFSWCDRTDVDRSGDVDWGDFGSSVSANWQAGVEYGWSEPYLHDELNDEGVSIALSPCLSEDGLTIYFNRYIPSLDLKCIVEAYRDTPDGPFTSERVASELVTTNHARNAWISDDELRLYYDEGQTGGSVVKMAARSSVGDTWTSVRTFDELSGDGKAGAPTLTSDELTIVFGSDNKPGGTGGYDLWIATRSEPNGVFSNIRALDEINTSGNEMQPSLLPDGLTLYYDKGYGTANWDIYKATRSSRDEPFGNIEYVGVNTDTYVESLCHIRSDGKALYFYSGRGDDGEGIWVSHWGRLGGGILPADPVGYWGGILPADPVGYWAFDEGAGDIAYDSVGGNDGILINDPNWTAGQIGGALEFDGVDEYVALSSTAVTTTEFTVSGWANHYGPGGGDFTANPIFVQRDDSIGDDHVWISLRAGGPDGGAAAGIRSSNGSTQALGYPRKDYHEWHHYAMTVSATDFVFYIDGVEVDRTSNNQQGDYVTSIDHVYIGKGEYTGNQGTLRSYFNGLIDEVMVWERALSAEEVEQVYQGGSVTGGICLPR
jgi:hypothetical protein